MKAGDTDAFEEIYDRYWEKLLAAAVKRIHSEEDAKDIVQDLFILLWERRESLVIQKSLGAYLYTAIKHRVINYVKANVSKGDYLSTLASAIAAYENSPDEQVMSGDLEAFINDRIDQFSPRIKEVFLLSRNENLSVKEIATRLQVSDQTVKNQLTKAVKDLRLYIRGGATTLILVFALCCMD